MVQREKVLTGKKLLMILLVIFFTVSLYIFFGTDIQRSVSVLFLENKIKNMKSEFQKNNNLVTINKMVDTNSPEILDRVVSEDLAKEIFISKGYPWIEKNSEGSIVKVSPYSDGSVNYIFAVKDQVKKLQSIRDNKDDLATDNLVNRPYLVDGEYAVLITKNASIMKFVEKYKSIGVAFSEVFESNGVSWVLSATSTQPSAYGTDTSKGLYYAISTNFYLKNIDPKFLTDSVMYIINHLKFN